MSPAKLAEPIEMLLGVSRGPKEPRVWMPQQKGTSVREYVFFVFFQISKKHDFLRFFEMTYQKVVKSHQQKFSPEYATKD